MATRIEPTETVMNITETKQQFSKVLNQVARGETRIVVEKSGAPVAAIISPQELQEFKRFKEKDDEVRERLHRNLAEFSHRFDDVSDEEFERVIAEARHEYREKTDREHGRI
jgi:prevent-host-death family protein